MDKIDCDICVIGSGPAGQKAAIQAAKLGKRAVVIEKDIHLGGASLNSGTIPSKTLREAIVDLSGFYKRSFYGKEAINRQVSIQDLMFRLHRVLDYQREMVLKQFSKNQITVLHGKAEFIDPHHINLFDESRLIATIKADAFIIATGSTPRNPNHVPFDQTTILDSTRLLAIDHVPASMLVLGGGVIGSEYASFFAALGTEVTIVDKRERLLPLLDQEIGTHFQSQLTEIGVRFVGNKEVTSIEKRKGGVRVTFSDGEEVSAEILLYALGRIANVHGLGIEKIGIPLSESGYIVVNERFQTIQPHIYAVGDVIGGPCLASTSMEQGRLAGCYACSGAGHPFPNHFPIGIYTIPEISSVGLTEEDVKEKKIEYCIGRAYYYEIARNQISGGDPGLFKIIFNAKTKEILGIHIIGRNATELIHIGLVAMSFQARIDYFIDQVFNYPTYAEGYRIAALNGVNKLSRGIIYRP